MHIIRCERAKQHPDIDDVAIGLAAPACHGGQGGEPDAKAGQAEPCSTSCAAGIREDQDERGQ